MINNDRTYIVCGGFDTKGGHKSYLGSIIMNTIRINGLNGGKLEDLKMINFRDYDVLIWMPNIPNSEEKLIGSIKLSNPKILLVSSKNVIGRHFNHNDMIGRLLQSHSNLGIMIDKKKDRYTFSLMDPLGNIYFDGTDVHTLCVTLSNRINFLLGLHRIGSIEVQENNEDIHIEPDFISVVKGCATEFSKHVSAVNPYRLLGNASARCSYGFPSMRRDDGRILVTRRNIDKRDIEEDGFVIVNNNESVVEYYGPNKPSVDTPIQIRLYNHFENINYIIHGHVYVEGGYFTKNAIPCGYIEEVDEITNIYDRSTGSITLNLIGHGCIIGSSTIPKLDKVKFLSRPIPEMLYAKRGV